MNITHFNINKSYFSGSNEFAPRFNTPPKSYYEAVPGSVARLKCDAVAIPRANISWTKDGIPVLTYKRVRIHKTTWQLRIRKVSLSDAGTYRCIASNKLGNITATMEFRVKQGIVTYNGF